MDSEHYDLMVENRAHVVRMKAEEWQEEESSVSSVLYSDDDELSEEDYLIEAAILEVKPSEECTPVELAEIYFECSEYSEHDIPMNWRDYPNNPADPIKANLEMVTNCIVRLDVLDRVGVDVSR